jgi:hypothetical protein
MFGAVAFVLGCRTCLPFVNVCGPHPHAGGTYVYLTELATVRRHSPGRRRRRFVTPRSRKPRPSTSKGSCQTPSRPSCPAPPSPSRTPTGLTRTVTTDESGRFVVRGLPPGGDLPRVGRHRRVCHRSARGPVGNAGQNVVLNFSLRLSTVQETITVAGDAPVVQTTAAEVSSTIDQRAFETLPVKERNYFRLLTLDSNVVATGTGSNAVNVGGQEVWNFGTYVDGTNNHSKWLTLQRAPQLGSSGFAIETVKEVQLITNQFSAEFGGHSSGVASMITKSGTNEFNGSGFVMVRPGDWDAAPPLAPVVNGREGEGPVQPAAVRRHRGRPAGPRQGCSSSAATSGAASAARSSSPRSRRQGWSCRRRPTNTRGTPSSTCGSPTSTRSACATTWSAGRRTTRAAGSTCRAPASSGTTTSTRCTARSRRSSRIGC